MPKTCVIVEDNPTMRSLLGEWLKLVFPHVEFIETENGESALVLVQALRPEAVIMDVTMPGINGLEATRRIKEIAPNTLVIMHTVHDSPTYRQSAKEAGADAYVSKHRTQKELVPILAGVFSDSQSLGEFK